MRKIGIPLEIVEWTERKLAGRTTVLKFDDYTSDPFEVTHGIDQGCPLSCIFYIIYNSDLIKVAKADQEELAAGYIDDVAFLVEAATFEEANEMLKDMMERRGGALEWAKVHTSEFALEKTALVGFKGRSSQVPAEVEIGGTVIKPVTSHKFLGVIFDEKLMWREQRQAVLKKATVWAQLIRRVCRVNHGLKPGAVRRLHDAIFLPKVTYAADVWWEPTVKIVGKKKKGAVGFTKRLQSVQRTVALAITGALRTSPTDALISHAGIYPIELELRRAAHRAAVRLAGIPAKNPIHEEVRREARRIGSRGRHPTTLRTLFITSNINPNDYATVPDTDDFSTSAKFLNPHIAVDKDTAIDEERHNSAEVKIYTDLNRNPILP
ncbi:reverse transcriptase, partial [Rhizoctonia solani AG-3 Rhs1AP]